MKILAINGSYRADQGLTGNLINRLFEGARAGEAECESVNLARLKMNRCLACDKCHSSQQYLRCVYAEKDEVANVFGKIACADLVIYATPVYLFGVSGLLKTFIDRIYGTSDVSRLRVTKSGLFFHDVDESVCSKPFVSLIVCDNLDPETPKNAREYFQTYARFMDAPQVGELTRNGGRLFANGRDPLVVDRFPKIKKVYASYEKAGYELAINQRVSAKTQREANQEVLTVPLFGLLKHLTPFKRVMVKKAQEVFK